MMEVFSRAADGERKLQENFRVREFACKDGTDPVFVDGELVEVLQKVRQHFGRAVTITSGYRTVAHNTKEKGSPRSQHMYGRAADFKVSGVGPDVVALYLEELLPDRGGIGVYPPKAGRAEGWVHVDVRPNKSRWRG